MLRLASLLSLALVLAGALSFRLGLLPLGTSFSTLALGLVACVLVSMTAAALIFRRLARKQKLGKLVMWLCLCLLPVAVVVSQVGLDSFHAPPIHDISTDLEQPPVFVFAQSERVPGDNTLEHGGAALAEQQRLGYPQLKPLHVTASQAVAWAAAKAVIADKQWRILGEDKDRGHIEAAATTPLMGFTDDVVIRIGTAVSKDIAVGGSDEPRSPPVENLVIDVRSVSRVGVSDLGKNAARIDSFLNALQNQLKN